MPSRTSVPRHHLGISADDVICMGGECCRVRRCIAGTLEGASNARHRFGLCSSDIVYSKSICRCNICAIDCADGQCRASSKYDNVVVATRERYGRRSCFIRGSTHLSQWHRGDCVHGCRRSSDAARWGNAVHRRWLGRATEPLVLPTTRSGA
jgi:hypothetical protein